MIMQKDMIEQLKMKKEKIQSQILQRKCQNIIKMQINQKYG